MQLNTDDDCALAYGGRSSKHSIRAILIIQSEQDLLLPTVFRLVSLERMQSLPAPTSGLFLEVSFRRLLKSCGDIIEGDSKGREDFKDWRSSPVFHHVSSKSLRAEPNLLSFLMFHWQSNREKWLHVLVLFCSLTVRGYPSRTASGPQVSRRKKVQLGHYLGPFHVVITFTTCKEVL